MTPQEFSLMIANQPGASDGLLDHGQATPPVREGVAPPGPGVSGPDNQPGLDDSALIGEFIRPDGGVAWLQLDNRATYEAKGFAFTGQTFHIDAYNQQVRELDKWRAIGNNPGANRATWPPPVTPPPAPLPGAMPSMQPAAVDKPSVAEPSPKPPLPPAHVNPTSIEV